MSFRSRLKERADRIRHERETRGQERQPSNPTASPLEGVKVKDAATQVLVDHLAVVQTGVRQRLDILRQTRPMRDVGSLKIPPHLQAPLTIQLGGGADDRNSPSGVEARGVRAGGDPEE